MDESKPATIGSRMPVIEDEPSDGPAEANGPEAKSFRDPTFEERELVLEALALHLQAVANPVSLINLGYRIATSDRPEDFVPANAVELARHARQLRAEARKQRDLADSGIVPGVLAVGAH